MDKFYNGAAGLFTFALAVCPLFLTGLVWFASSLGYISPDVARRLREAMDLTLPAVGVAYCVCVWWSTFGAQRKRADRVLAYLRLYERRRDPLGRTTPSGAAGKVER